MSYLLHSRFISFGVVSLLLLTIFFAALWHPAFARSRTRHAWPLSPAWSSEAARIRRARLLHRSRPELTKPDVQENL